MEGIWETGLTVYYLYPKRFDSLAGVIATAALSPQLSVGPTRVELPHGNPVLNQLSRRCAVFHAHASIISPFFFFAKKVGYQGDTFPSDRPVLEINLDSNLFLSEQTWLRE